MSPNDDNPEEVKKGKEKFLWFGFGGYAGWVEPAAFNPTNIRADIGIFDKLLELFGVKDKKKEEAGESKLT